MIQMEDFVLFHLQNILSRPNRFSLVFIYTDANARTFRHFLFFHRQSFHSYDYSPLDNFASLFYSSIPSVTRRPHEGKKSVLVDLYILQFCYYSYYFTFSHLYSHLCFVNKQMTREREKKKVRIMTHLFSFQSSHTSSFNSILFIHASLMVIIFYSLFFHFSTLTDRLRRGHTSF